MATKPLGFLLFVVVLFGASGCMQCGGSLHSAFAPAGPDDPKKLLEWAVGGEHKKNGNGEDKDKESGNGKKNGNGKDGDGKNGKNGTGKDDEDKAPERDTIATDRPDFTEASVAVGKGRVQLEAGYTFIRDRDSSGARVHNHSYPEALLRIGMFADWFEFRIGQNLGSEHEPTLTKSAHGAQDLYLGMRFDLTEQKGIYPESSLVVQTTVPTGHSQFTAKQMLPGFNLLYGWDIIEEKVTLGASTQINRRVDDDGHFYAEYAQSFTVGYKWTPKLGQYTEWFALVPAGAVSGENRTQHYLDGGFTYLITDNFQLDIRAGVGLNRAAADFFAGSGFGIRY